MKADNGIALPQTTFYTYAADAVNNDALKEVQHPDSGKVTYEYNRAGEQTKMTDQNGTEHTYSYDRAGRRRTDVVTVGSGVDDAVERIDWTFDNRGRLEKVTSFDSPFGTTAVNEVQYTYNEFGQVTKEQQQHDGAVVAGSPAVEYGYADGSDNHIRMDWVKYPGGRQVDYDYGTAGSQNDRLSRVTQLDDSDGGDVLYQYAGVDQPMQCNYAQPNVTWSIPGGESGGYTGLDRFGRVIELEWNSKKSGLVAGFEYGYDRRGNRLFESNSAIAQATGTSPVAVEALLEYDNLDRVVDFQRGTLSGTNDAITGANLTQDWTLDQLGNWDAFNQGVTNALAQTRTHNSVNEITDIDETSGTSWPNPAYDSNGNMTELPQPNSLSDPSPGSYDAKWDAWNRLVELKDGTNVVARYEYDGLNRRIIVAEETVIEGINAGFLESDIEIIPEQFDGLPEAGEFDATGTYFKTRSGTINIGAINGGVAVDDNATGTGWIMYSVANVDTRFTVHNNNADHLVAVRLNGTQWQYNTNLAWVNFTPVASDHLIAAVDFSANTAELLGDRRFYYSQSAQCLEEHRGTELDCQYLWGLRFVDDLVLRDRDTTGDGTLNERLYALHDLRFSVVALADPDSLIVERYTYDAYGVRTVLEPDYDSRAVSSYAFDFAYTGRRLDLDTGLYYFRARYYHPQLGIFIGRDPLGFVDGMNLYRAYFVPEAFDPFGEFFGDPGWDAIKEYYYREAYRYEYCRQPGWWPFPIRKEWWYEPRVPISGDELWEFLKLHDPNLTDGTYDWLGNLSYSKDRLIFNEGCIGVSKTLTGQCLNQNTDGSLKECYGNLEAALEAKEGKECPEDCHVFAFAWENKPKDPQPKIPANGPVVWGRCKPNSHWDYGYYVEKLDLFLHALGATHGKSAKDNPYFISNPQGFLTPGFNTIYCVTCDK